MPRRRNNLKPAWPFALNTESAQSKGLVAWYPGYPFSGGKLLDLSGYGKHGTLTNFGFSATSGWNRGKEGGLALLLDGTNDYVDLGDNFGGLAKITVSCWVMSTSVPGAGTVREIISKWGNEAAFDTTDSFVLNYGDPDGLRWYLGGPDAGCISSGGFSANVRYHVAGTYDGATARLYINGHQAVSGVASGTLNAAAGTTSRIGGAAAPSGQLPHIGTIEDIRIYNRALDASEVFAMYDPRTRWDLRTQRSTTAYSLPFVAASGGIAKLIHPQFTGGLS